MESRSTTFPGAFASRTDVTGTACLNHNSQQDFAALSSRNPPKSQQTARAVPASYPLDDLLRIDFRRQAYRELSAHDSISGKGT